MLRSSSIRAIIMLCLFPAACVSLAPRSQSAGEEAVAIDGVPARRWANNNCAAGALAEVLNWLGDGTTENQLIGGMARAAHGGVVTVDLLLETRRHGFDARLVRGDFDLVRRELRQQHPLIVMLRVLDVRGSRNDLFHYVVLSGIDPRNDLVYLHYGDGRKRWVALRDLERGWAAGGYATFLIGRKAKRKATDDDLKRAVLLEDEGKLRESIALYRFFLDSHPQSDVAWTNLGNAQSRAGESQLAETAYRNALVINRDNAEALNNLAWLLLERRDLDEAEAFARRAVALNPADRAAVLDTLSRILAARKGEVTK